MTGRRRHRGHALLGTMAFLILIMLLWTVAFARLGGYMRVTKAGLARHDRITGQTRAMAWGLAILETGEPPQDPYACRVAPDAATPTRFFVLTYRVIAPWQYSVTVRPSGPDDGELPLVPADFGPGNGKPRGENGPPATPTPPAPPIPSKPGP